MSWFMIIGGIISLLGGFIALGFEQKWGMYVTAVGVFIALFSLKPEKRKDDTSDDKKN